MSAVLQIWKKKKATIASVARFFKDFYIDKQSTHFIFNFLGKLKLAGRQLMEDCMLNLLPD